MAVVHLNELPAAMELEEAIVERARIALGLHNRKYVDAFLAELPSGIEAAIAAGSPHLGDPPWWYELMTALLRVELTMDHVKHALELIRVHRANAIREDGKLLSYHVDSWTIQSMALLEKVDYLICRVYRVLVKQVDPQGWNRKLAAARAPLAELITRYGNVRHPLVHGLVGSEKALEDERMWEGHVLVGGNIGEMVAGFYESVAERREKWYEENMARTALVVAVIESTLSQAVKHVRGAA